MKTLLALSKHLRDRAIELNTKASSDPVNQIRYTKAQEELKRLINIVEDNLPDDANRIGFGMAILQLFSELRLDEQKVLLTAMLSDLPTDTDRTDIFKLEFCRECGGVGGGICHCTNDE